MEVIWKYEIGPDIGQEIEMPEDARILDLQVQNSIPCLWVLANPDNKKIKRNVGVVGTGWEIEKIRGDYAGTFQMGGGSMVFHVFID